MKLDNFLYLPLIGLVIAFSYLNVVNYGFLKGLLKFSCFAINQFSGALLRLLTGIMLIFLGFKVFGAIWPSLFSYVLIFLLGLFQLRFLFTKIKKTNIKIPSGDIIKYAIPTTLAILSLSSFISIDVILVKHFFNAHDAGLYSGLSLVGKVIYYLTGMIPLVMFPLVVKRQAKGESIVNLFYLAVFIVTIPSVLITCFYYLFPSFSISLFLGKEYLRAIPYLGLFGVYLTIFSILNICVNFFLSIGKTKIFIPVFVAAILQIVFIYAYHNSFYQVIGISITIISILLIYLLFIFIKEFINLRSVKNFLENSINSQQLN